MREDHIVLRILQLVVTFLGEEKMYLVAAAVTGVSSPFI